MRSLIREGDRSQQVADVQTRLRSLGIEIDDETGVFGAATRQAVRTFQQQRDILVDGIVGPQTWSELVEASWRLGDRALYLRQPPMRGDDVSSLQTQLNALGFDAGRQDGIFGRDTDLAVRAFQKEYGVAEDGIFGAMSYAALIGLRVDRPGTTRHLREQISRNEHPGLRSATVVIDPGHGGADRGAPAGNRDEADVTWDIATRLAELLVLHGAHVRFTRTEVESPDASERAQRANAIDGDIFISLHLNEHDKTSAEGSSTYYFGGSSAGRELAERIQDELVELGLKDCRSHARSYTILKETRMPAVLVEPVFITNPQERERLSDPSFLREAAGAIARAVERYFNERDPGT
ncbi:MAG TPA: N-acetylmuramoyl-L-alanine amidase [Actinomycetota bacterium]|nr:N-acetylmuramoyl-L-alanine amidase [Actinomycetota bacterium]